MNETLKKFTTDVTEEKTRVKKMADTLDGANKLFKVYFNQFGENAIHINEVISNIARVNVLRRNECREILI